MMSLHKSTRWLQQCRTLASAAVRRRGGGGSSSSWPQQRVLLPLQLHHDSSQSKRTVSDATDQHYTSFAYRSHPSAPVTVGWVNLEQQQWQHHSLPQQRAGQRQPQRRAAQRPPRAAVSALDNNGDDSDGLFYGLPLRVDEPPSPLVASALEEATAAAAAAPMTLEAPAAATTEDGDSTPPEELAAMNRNARRAKRANGGKRPCSRMARREKKRSIGNHRR